MEFILAVLPGIVIIVFLLLIGRLDEQPASLLLLIPVFSVVSVFIAVLIEMGAEAVLRMFIYDPGSIIYKLIDNIFGVALIEELAKFNILFLFTWWSKSFRSTYDGVVYAVYVSVVFATVENVFYVLDGGLFTAILRCFISVPGHAAYAVLMGYFYGMAKYEWSRRNENAAVLNIVKGIFVSVGLHGLYDFFLSTDYIVLIIFGVIYGLATIAYCVREFFRLPKISRKIQNEGV